MQDKYIVICDYCGFQEQKSFFYKPKTLNCKQCDDKNTKIKKINYTNVFGYSDKEIKSFEDDDDIYDMTDLAD
jgi:hypothetical protein